MKKNNSKSKLIKLFAFISTFFLIAGIALIVVSILFKDQEFASILLYSSLGGLGASLIFGIIAYLIYKKDLVEKELLASNLSISIDSYKAGEKKLVIPGSSSNGLNNLAANINTLGYSDVRLTLGATYSKEDFLSLLPKDLKNRSFSSAYIIWVKGASKRFLRKLEEKIGELVLVEVGSEYYGLTYDVSPSSIEIALSRLLKEDPKLSAIYVAYPFKGFEEVIEQFNAIYTEQSKIYKVASEDKVTSYAEYLKECTSIDIDKDESLTEFLKTSLGYLDLTHIAIKVDGKYLRQVTFTDLPMFAEMKQEDFLYLEERPLLARQAHEISLILANSEKYRNVNVDMLNQEVLFLSLLKSLLNVYLDNLTKLEKDTRIDEMETLTGVYSYTINKDYELRDASADLKNKVDFKPGLKCYKALFGLDKPCKNCPLNQEIRDRVVPILGSGAYEMKVKTNQEYKDIFFMPNSTKALLSVDKLHERLLDLINLEKKGYTLCVKIENIDDLASRNKTDIGSLIAGIYSRFSSYGLANNLYMKAKDEYVFILEDISRVEAIEVAKKVTFALNDKLDIGKKGIVIPYRIILLSFPLEVSSIFALDSLCRTMFEAADKRGRLYMLDEEPLPIDKHRYYIETLEESFKKDDIPLVYINTLDRKEKKTYKEIHLNFFDYEGRPMKEDEITLFAKQDGTYLTLIERLVRQLSFGENDYYILPLAKEGLVKQNLDMIILALRKKKVDPARLVIQIRERDYDRFYDVVNESASLGLVFGISNLLNYSKYEFKFKPALVRVNLSKYNNDSEYASRVIDIVNRGIDISTPEIIEVFDNRFIESK